MVRLGCRRLHALVTGLPKDAAAWRQENEWTWQEELAAAQIEITDMWMRILAITHGQKPRVLPKPVHILRPGEQAAREKVETDPRVIAAWFRQHLK